MSAPDPRCQAALERLLASGASRVHPPSVLPAREVVELSGEAIRNRLCAFQDNSGGEFAMRPDMTSPIAMMLAEGRIGTGRYAYCGDVYRLPRTGRHDDVEFEQVGFEWFGAEGADADAEALDQALGMMQAVGAARTGIAFGDVGLFRAVVGALGFSSDWVDRLRRSFYRQRGPAALLEAAIASGEAESASIRLGRELARLEMADASGAVEAELEKKAAPVLAGRSVQDIAERLIERARSELPSREMLARLRGFLSIRVPGARSVEAVREWANDAGVVIAEALDALDARNAAVARLAPKDWDIAEFDARMGRRFEYYDGFAFELSTGGKADAPLVSGGRYDGLVGRIDPEQPTVAIGAALRADRLASIGAGA